VSKRWWGWAVGSLVVAVLAFLFLNWILALFVAIMAVTLLVVGALASTWDSASTYEQRELVRARKRAEKWERNAGARAKDRALWEEHKAKQTGG
jgi:hypothetical protein